MKDTLKDFFDNNHEANEVHVVLGYTCATLEEANAKLAGVRGIEVSTYTREQVDEMFSDKAGEPLESELLTQFKKMPVGKMIKQIEQQETIVAKLEASFKAEADQDKAKQSLDFHWKLLSDMQDALKDKQEETV
jgi:hypothetical protein